MLFLAHVIQSSDIQVAGLTTGSCYDSLSDRSLGGLGAMKGKHHWLPCLALPQQFYSRRLSDDGSRLIHHTCSYLSGVDKHFKGDH